MFVQLSGLKEIQGCQLITALPVETALQMFLWMILAAAVLANARHLWRHLI
jgi:hypothetical protein